MKGDAYPLARKREKRTPRPIDGHLFPEGGPAKAGGTPVGVPLVGRGGDGFSLLIFFPFPLFVRSREEVVDVFAVKVWTFLR